MRWAFTWPALTAAVVVEAGGRIGKHGGHQVGGQRALQLGRNLFSAAVARRVGESGLRAYRAQASEEVLGARWRALLERLL